ncbi:MAG: metalloregulator ArsR/SmtB family transcription factor [Armatimonadetes bacterium]|nr:metalloregulator ArsR/SmtB family transcription factor [Armatimonadota bacterium]
MEEAFKALGDATRLRIVRMLAENGEMCVCTIVDELGMGQSAVSFHMSTLKHAGLLRSRKQFQWIHYSLNVEALENGPFAFLGEIVGATKASASTKVSSECCK